jgi:Cu(I)/Ag(I) efflux system membrane protein CusA/SilA
MVGGMITAPLLSMFVVPVVYLMIRRRRGFSLNFV